MEFIVFKNSQIIYRAEAFGGILYHRSHIFLLNKVQFEFLKSFDEYKYYRDLNNYEKVITGQFLKRQIFLKIDIEKAEKIIKDGGSIKRE